MVATSIKLTLCSRSYAIVVKQYCITYHSYNSSSSVVSLYYDIQNALSISCSTLMHAIVSCVLQWKSLSSNMAPAWLTIVIVRMSNILNVYNTSVLPIIVIYFNYLLSTGRSVGLAWFRVAFIYSTNSSNYNNGT